VRDHVEPLVALLEHGPPDGLVAEDAAAANACVKDLLELHGMSQRDDVREVFFSALERSHFLSVFDLESGPARMQMGANLNKLGELLEGFAEWSDDRRVSAALGYLSVLRNSKSADEIAAIEPIEDGIVLLTAHAAKGLEWPVVFLGCCVEARWASRPSAPYRIELPDELVPEPAPAGESLVDEERRLFYVAATRARDRLVFTWAHWYARMYREQRPSQFLGGLLAPGASVDVHRMPRAAVVAARPRRARGEPLRERLAVSVSDLRAFKECPRRYEYRVRYRLPVRDTVQSWYGTLIHGVLQAAAVQRLGGVDVDAESVARLWQEAWDRSSGPKGEHFELRALGEEQLRRYIASPAWSDARIRSAEDRFGLQLAHADVTGRFDRVDSTPDGPTVVDYKTSRPRSADAVAGDLQVRAYAVAMANRDMREGATVELHYLQTAEVTRSRLDRTALERARFQLAATAEELEAAWSSGHFPARPSRWRCRGCGYRTVCDEGAGAGAGA
jgi:DNA helicase-2/ATP-dependent DNA helicase PcrA